MNDGSCQLPLTSLTFRHKSSTTSSSFFAAVFFGSIFWSSNKSRAAESYWDRACKVTKTCQFLIKPHWMFFFFNFHYRAKYLNYLKLVVCNFHSHLELVSISVFSSVTITKDFVFRVWLSLVIFHWLKQILTKVTLTDYNWSIESNWPINSDQAYQKWRGPAHSAGDKNVCFCFYLWLVGSDGCPKCSGKCLWSIIPIWQVKPQFQGRNSKESM